MSPPGSCRRHRRRARALPSRGDRTVLRARGRRDHPVGRRRAAGAQRLARPHSARCRPRRKRTDARPGRGHPRYQRRGSIFPRRVASGWGMTNVEVLNAESLNVQAAGSNPPPFQEGLGGGSRASVNFKVSLRRSFTAITEATPHPHPTSPWRGEEFRTSLATGVSHASDAGAFRPIHATSPSPYSTR